MYPKGPIPGELRQLEALSYAHFHENNFRGKPSVAGDGAVKYLAILLQHVLIVAPVAAGTAVPVPMGQECTL